MDCVSMRSNLLCGVKGHKTRHSSPCLLTSCLCHQCSLRGVYFSIHWFLLMSSQSLKMINGFTDVASCVFFILKMKQSIHRKSNESFSIVFMNPFLTSVSCSVCPQPVDEELWPLPLCSPRWREVPSYNCIELVPMATLTEFSFSAWC